MNILTKTVQKSLIPKIAVIPKKSVIPKINNNLKFKQNINTNESNYDWLMRIMKEDKKDEIFLL